MPPRKAIPSLNAMIRHSALAPVPAATSDKERARQKKALHHFISRLAERTQKVAETRYTLNLLTKGYSSFVLDLGCYDAAALATLGYPSQRADAKWRIAPATAGKKYGEKCSQVGYSVDVLPGATEEDIRELKTFFDRAMQKYSRFFYEGSADTDIPPPEGGKPLMMLDEQLQLVPRVDAAGVQKLSALYPAELAQAPDVVRQGFAILHSGTYSKTPLAPIDPALEFGTLGVAGPNGAVDPIIFVIRKDGTLAVIGGKRPTGEFAFPGGMAEGRAFEAVRKESLEEVYGGSLFEDIENPADPSTTAFLINQKDPAIVASVLRNLLCGAKPHSELGKITPIAAAVSEIIDNRELTNNQKIVAIKRLIDSSPLIDAVDKIQLKVRMQCLIYEQALLEKFAVLTSLIERLRPGKGQPTRNKTDPRNTPKRWMYTTPYSMVIEEDELEQITKEAGLHMKAGDDLGDPGLIPLDVFLANPFSDHGRLALEQWLIFMEKNPDFELTDAMRVQFQNIEDLLQKQEWANEMDDVNLQGNEHYQSDVVQEMGPKRDKELQEFIKQAEQMFRLTQTMHTGHAAAPQPGAATLFTLV